MTTLNDLPPYWDFFIQTISGRTKLPKFDRLWADCTQEETGIAARQRLHGPQVEENQPFITHAKKGKEKGRNFHKHQARRPSARRMIYHTYNAISARNMVTMQTSALM